MKNKKHLKLSLIIFGFLFILNNYCLGQDQGGSAIQESFTYRSYASPIKFCKSNKCWAFDTLDLVGSIDKQKLKYEEERKKSLYKTDNHTIDSLLKIASSSKEDLEHRAVALNSLMYIDSKRQIVTIQNMLLNENCDSCSGIRGACVVILRNLNSIDSKPILIKALNDKDFYVKFESALYLASIGEKIYCFKILKSIWNLNLGYKTRCHEGFRDINTPEAVDMLRLAMKDTDQVVAVDAAATLAELNFKDEAFLTLKELLITGDMRIKLSVMRILAYYIGDYKSFDLIKQMHNDNDINVKEYSQAILKKYKIK